MPQGVSSGPGFQKSNIHLEHHTAPVKIRRLTHWPTVKYTMSEQKPSLTYRDAGVDIDAGNVDKSVHHEAGDDIIKVDLGNGQYAKMNPNNLKTLEDV